MLLVDQGKVALEDKLFGPESIFGLCLETSVFVLSNDAPESLREQVYEAQILPKVRRRCYRQAFARTLRRFASFICVFYFDYSHSMASVLVERK